MAEQESPFGPGTGNNPIEDLNIRPDKIGYLTDLHYGIESGSWVSDAEKETKLDEFASAMNNWGKDGADVVLFGGDNTAGQSSKSAGQSDITTLRDYIEPKLNCDLKPMWGNHEYKNATSWGVDWSYSPWGVSSDTDTYYTIDLTHTRVIVLNTGYDTTDSLDSGVPSGQLSWLNDRLEETDKPVLITTHTPPAPVGSQVDYDLIGDLTVQDDYARTIANHDNVAGVMFGHCHHEAMNGKPNASFNHSFAQPYLGVPYIYQHYPNGLGGSEYDGSGGGLDTSHTPFAKLHLYPNGHLVNIQSYVDESTSYQGRMRFDGSGRMQSEAEPMLTNLNWEYHEQFGSLDGYWIETNGTGATAEIRSIATGVGHVRFQTGPNAGNYAKMALIRRPAYRNVTDINWPSFIWNFTVEFPSVDTGTGNFGLSDLNGWLINGKPDGPYIGIRLNDGFAARCHDGSSFTEKNIANPDPDTPTTYQIQHYADKGRVDFRCLKNDGLGRDKLSIAQNVPSLTTTAGDANAPNHHFHAEVVAQINENKRLRIHSWDMVRGVDLSIDN